MFQRRVADWVVDTFGEKVATDKAERNFRFLEEALELVQACGATKDDVLKLVEYVFSRPVGELPQEVGGTVVTLAALCNGFDVRMEKCAWDELARNWLNQRKIRRKHFSKPIRTAAGDPLPGGA
jgi:hypothetical protein